MVDIDNTYLVEFGVMNTRVAFSSFLTLSFPFLISSFFSSFFSPFFVVVVVGFFGIVFLIFLFFC